MGLVWVWWAARRKWSRCGGRGRPKAAILFLDGAFGGNCGTAIGMGSGWTGDGIGAGPGVGGKKEGVGVGAQVRSRRATIVSWVGALVGNGVEVWCWRSGGEKEVGARGRCGGGPKATIFRDGGFGGNCGTAIGMGSGWTGDGLGALVLA
jgi:hypothetical protein